MITQEFIDTAVRQVTKLLDREILRQELDNRERVSLRLEFPIEDNGASYSNWVNSSQVTDALQAHYEALGYEVNLEDVHRGRKRLCLTAVKSRPSGDNYPDTGGHWRAPWRACYCHSPEVRREAPSVCAAACTS